MLQHKYVAWLNVTTAAMAAEQGYDCSWHPYDGKHKTFPGSCSLCASVFCYRSAASVFRASEQCTFYHVPFYSVTHISRSLLLELLYLG